MPSPTTESPLNADAEQATKEYRPRDSHWWVGVLGTAFFGQALVVSVGLALWNPDGAFPNPALFAAVFGLIWGGFTLLCVYVLADYYRSRLVISPESVVQVGVLRSKGIEFDDVQEAWWRVVPVGGSLKLRDSRTRMTVEFANVSLAERAEVIERLRSHIAVERQVGWEAFVTGNAERQTNPRVALASSLLLLATFGSFALAPLVVGPRGWIQGPNLTQLIVPNLLGVALAGRMVWRAWDRIRAERRGDGGEISAIEEVVSGKRR